MILGSGIDIVRVDKIRYAVDRWGERFLSRVYTWKERDYCSKKVNKFQNLAGRFACKEAVSKALKMKWKNGINWKQIEIVNNRNAEPVVKLAGQAKEVADSLKVENIHLSISHCRDYSVAMAVVIGVNNGKVTRDY